METDFRIVAQIYRAIGDASSTTRVDESKCERIASLIARDDNRERIEALIEQYADRIDSMAATDFVGMLRNQASRFASVPDPDSFLA